jgi:DNA-binding NarL/FixJ family response regulator
VIRVAVVDDQVLVRAGLRALLEMEDDLDLVAEASDGRAGVAAARRTMPDVMLMDIRMPVLDGLAALREITADPVLSRIRVVMLTTFEFDEYVFEALRAGASGFVLKDADSDELVRAVRVAANGGSLLSPSVTRRVIERFTVAPPRRAAPGWSTPHPEVDRLTDREREILTWVATGRSNDEIAAELVVSAATVRTHVSRAMVKLGARDRAQLVVFAVQAGLAPSS